MATLPIVPLVIEAGNSPPLEMIVRDNITGLYLSDAVVTVTIKDQAGNEVGGEVWPLILNYVPGSQGQYLAVLEDDVEMLVGETYTAFFEISVDGIKRFARRDLYVEEAIGAPNPATNPTSPAFQGPSLRTRLNQAEAALHRLMLGETPSVVVDQNGERVEYAAGNQNRLSSYVESLKIQLGDTVRRPMRPYW